MLENWIYTCKKKKIKQLSQYLTLYITTKLKQVKEVSVKAKIVSLLEDKIGRRNHKVGFDSYFWDMIPKAQATKVKIVNLDYVKI